MADLSAREARGLLRRVSTLSVRGARVKFLDDYNTPNPRRDAFVHRRAVAHHSGQKIAAAVIILPSCAAKVI